MAQTEPITYGNSADFAALLAAQPDISLVGDSQSTVYTHNAVEGQQSIRLRFGIFQNWDLNWSKVIHPGGNGSLGSGSALNIPGTAHPTGGFVYRIVSPGTAVDAAFDGKVAGDVAYFPASAFPGNLADLAELAAGATFAWLNQALTIYRNHSAATWFDGAATRARLLYVNTTSPATLRITGTHSGSVNSAEFVHPGTGDTMRNIEVALSNASATDSRIYIRGGTTDETGKTFGCAGAMWYKYDVNQPGGFAVGSSVNPICAFAGQNASYHVTNISQTALTEMYKNTIPPTDIVIMLGHNSGNSQADLQTIGSRHLAAAAAARAALSMPATPARLFYVVPWFSSAAGGLDTVQKGIDLRNDMITCAKNLNGNVISLFDYFLQQNPLMNTAHLHPDAVNNTANTDVKTISIGLYNAIKIGAGTRIGVRNRNRTNFIN